MKMQTVKKGSKPIRKVLRQAWKKWEHIEGSTAFLICLLRAAWSLEVNGDCPEGLKVDGQPPDNKKLLGSFLMLMRQMSMAHAALDARIWRREDARGSVRPLQTAGNGDDEWL